MWAAELNMSMFRGLFSPFENLKDLLAVFYSKNLFFFSCFSSSQLMLDFLWQTQKVFVDLHFWNQKTSKCLYLIFCMAKCLVYFSFTCNTFCKSTWKSVRQMTKTWVILVWEGSKLVTPTVQSILSPPAIQKDHFNLLSSSACSYPNYFCWVSVFAIALIWEFESLFVILFVYVRVWLFQRWHAFLIFS